MSDVAEKAMRLVAKMDPKAVAKSGSLDAGEVDMSVEDEGLEVAAIEMMDAMKADDTKGFVEALRNFLEMTRS